MYKRQKGFANLVLIGIISLLVIAGGYFVWKGKSKKVENVSNAEVSSWKTYTNDKYGFELKLPNDWEVKEHQVSDKKYYLTLDSIKNAKYFEESKILNKDIATEGPANNIYITYYENISDESGEVSKSQTLEEYLKSTPIVSDVKKISFAGQEAYSGNGGGLYNMNSLWFLKDNHLYRIDMALDGAMGIDSKLNEAIISTFKFTK